MSVLRGANPEDQLDRPSRCLLKLDIADTTRRGFTGHEHLDNISLVHMNGRVYDPRLGRFLSADPYIDGADSTQGWNRYSYVRNGLLNAIDPSGFFCSSADGCDKGALFTGAPRAYIYGSRIPEREPNRIKDWVAALPEPGVTAGEAIFSTAGELFFEPIPEPYRLADGPDLATVGGFVYGSMNLIGDGLAYRNRMWGYWRGKNGLWYRDTWPGNASTGGRNIPFSRAASWKLVGNVGATVALMISAGTIVEAIDDGRPGDAVKPTFDIGMVGWSATAGPPGWVIGSTYFLIDATMGWGPALNSMDRNIRENQAILGPTWSPFRD